MNKQTVLLKKAYYAYNTRNINAALAIMHQDICWANGMQTGYVNGHDQLRNYWMNQWTLTDPDVEPISIVIDPNGKVVAQVRQVVRDLKENILSDEVIEHVYTLKDGLIASMDVRNIN